MIYHLQSPFVIDGEAPSRFATPSITEIHRAEKSGRGFNRCIGGDQGDLYFDCYDVGDGQTTLSNAALSTSHEDLTDDEVMDIAREIFDAAFASIGWDAVT